MNIIFSFDDGRKSQLRFYKETGLQGTYFILPTYTDVKTTHPSLHKENICAWDEVKQLAEHGELGFHGHSVKSYNKWGDERINKHMEKGIGLIQDNTGYFPVSFAYTEMKPGRIDLISQYCPYIRDYFWRDGGNPTYKYDDNGYQFRVNENDVPVEFLGYREKIYVRHPTRGIEYMLKKAGSLSEYFEYYVLIIHELDDALIAVAKELAKHYKVITFREIFK